jgi:hypothetical protein
MGDHGMPSMTAVGHLEMGTAANPIAVGQTADIVIANTALGGGASDPEQFGTGLINLGKVTMHGANMSATFLRLAVEPRAGNSTLTMARGSQPTTRLRPCPHRRQPPASRPVQQSRRMARAR